MEEENQITWKMATKMDVVMRWLLMFSELTIVHCWVKFG